MVLRLKFFSLLRKNFFMIKYDKNSRYNASARKWYNSAIKHLEKNKFEEALYALNNAIELIPDYPEAWYNKGYVLEELKRPDKALFAYNKAIELNTNYTDAWFAKGIALCELNEADKAVESFDRVIELDPQDYQALTLKGYALIQINRIDEAFKIFSAIIESNPDSADAWYNIACIYAVKGNMDKALECLSKAVKTDNTLKKYAPSDKFFKNLSQTEEFKKMTS